MGHPKLQRKSHYKTEGGGHFEEKVPPSFQQNGLNCMQCIKKLKTKNKNKMRRRNQIWIQRNNYKPTCV